MIDKQKFNENYNDFGAETIIDVIIDPFQAEQPKYISLLEKNIADHDLLEIKWNVHKLKSICGLMFDFDSNRLGEILENAALLKILTLVDIMMQSKPDELNRIKDEFEGVSMYMEIYRNKSIEKFLSGYLGPLPDADVKKLQELEKELAEDGIPEMFNAFKASSLLLLEELAAMKSDLNSKS
jgi:hypothetical protein